MTWIVVFFVVVLLLVGAIGFMARGQVREQIRNDPLPILALKIEGLCSAMHKRGLAAGRYDAADLKSAERGPRGMVAAWELMEWSVPGVLDMGRSGTLVEAIGLMNCATAICGSFLRLGVGKGPVLDQIDLASDVCFAMFLGGRQDIEEAWIREFVEMLAVDRNQFASVVDQAIVAMSLPPTDSQVMAIGRLVKERLAAVQIRYDDFQAARVN